MRFKTKDLLVTVVPKATIDVQDIAKICLLRTHICRSPSVCFSPTLCGTCSFHLSCFCSLHGTFGCGFGNSCGPGNSVCDPTIFCPGGSREPWVIEDIEDLATIRRELQETVQQLDAIEKEGLPGSIKTKADAEALEASLTQALEQVRAQKKNLK
jgi:hypothetical protein